MDLQDKFDSTITMVLDECTAFPATYEAAESSMEMSMRWANSVEAGISSAAGIWPVRHRPRRHLRGPAPAFGQLH